MAGKKENGTSMSCRALFMAASCWICFIMADLGSVEEERLERSMVMGADGEEEEEI